MSPLTVDLLTADRTLVTGAPCEGLTAPGINGAFQALPQHTTFLTELEVGPVILAQNGQERRFFVAGGLAEVSRDHVRILADAAVAAEAVDRAAIEQELKEVTDTLAQADPYSAEAARLRTQQRYLELQRTAP